MQRQKEALFSTVHGAGRVMSRTQAAGQRAGELSKVISAGPRLPGDDARMVRRKGVILRGGGLDESPHVYRRLPDVLGRASRTPSPILHTLRPLIVAMAGPDEFDPYKD